MELKDAYFFVQKKLKSMYSFFITDIFHKLSEDPLILTLLTHTHKTG